MREWCKLHEVVLSLDIARGFAGVYENQKSLLGRETAHNPNPSGGERGERVCRSGLLMKALSGRVRIL